ncbi:unnamed protein product [Moneuplotes crassus]|uniref:Uncharacterized protein n=1 Tax=Euplotes crassus TaxID=5936 RepID=A0AAD2D2E2_EUPCR|nr:unnamed protein product [Moneuplotes crassus]
MEPTFQSLLAQEASLSALLLSHFVEDFNFMAHCTESKDIVVDSFSDGFLKFCQRVVKVDFRSCDVLKVGDLEDNEAWSRVLFGREEICKVKEIRKLRKRVQIYQQFNHHALKEINMYHNGQDKELLNFQSICKPLCNTLTNGSSSITLKAFEVSKKSFKRLICVYNLQTLAFTNCQVDTENVKFPIHTNFTLEKLLFEGLNTRITKEWRENPEKIYSLIRAISECSLRDSLKLVFVDRLIDQKEILKELVDDLKLSSIKFAGRKAEDMRCWLI